MTAKKSKETNQAFEQQFAITAPTAQSVLLVGDFTHWQKAPLPMKKERDGIWRIRVPLEPGVHHYRFMVDGEWRDDPECTIRVSSPYGSENMVRKVEAAHQVAVS